jgi:hypothetical protein
MQAHLWLQDGKGKEAFLLPQVQEPEAWTQVFIFYSQAPQVFSQVFSQVNKNMIVLN